ncbi:lysine exporter LysO family protein [Anoxybacterium hadale]|uniref:Lysine exporter LysO family protein n=1 Tax=Anoxybacterium hadale TaxID=3408580 RepID=A0ACD1AEW3_9FIRM|nr:lysine exporter LysO family protein [Clostridiales bacterium]
MIWIPFLCLTIGLFFGLRNLSERIMKQIDRLINAALVILMVTIGLNIGINDSVMLNLPRIGFNCVIISLSAIGISVLFTLLTEKTLLPLDAFIQRLNSETTSEIGPALHESEPSETGSPLLWLIPLSILTGVVLGYYLFPSSLDFVLGYLLTGSLVVLYTSVGISLGANRKVFRYIKLLGFRVIYLSVAIFAGSVSAGFLSGLLLGLPLQITVMSATGMSYYSITGAYMTQVYGIEAGTYGFVVNVMREFFTVLLLPLLIKISKGSSIAGGAAGNMDTMLVPVTKLVGTEVGLVALITGTILTFAVPFLLPLLYHIM